MEKQPLQPGMYASVVQLFEKRVVARDLTHVEGVPYYDDDIIEFAQNNGLSQEQILAACILARSRISGHTGIELVNVTELEIAENYQNVYKKYEGNRNLN